MRKGFKYKKYIYELEFEERVQYELDKIRVCQAIQQVIAEFEKEYGENINNDLLVLKSNKKGIQEVKIL